MLTSVNSKNGLARMSLKGNLTTKMPKNEYHLGGLKSYLTSLSSPYSLNSLTQHDRRVLNNGVLLVENEVWGYLDTLGKIAIAPAYEFAMDFKNGTAIVQYNGQWGTIDTNEKNICPLLSTKSNLKKKPMIGCFVFMTIVPNMVWSIVLEW